MNYASASRRPNPAAMAGALGIPGALGALMVVGLAVTVVTAPPPPRLTAQTITETVLPPPPPPKPEPQPEAKATNTAVLDTVVPPRPGLPQPDFVIGRPVPLPPGTGDPAATGTGTIDLGIPGPTPSAALFDPVRARPTNNPGRWITDADYKSRWIMEDMEGTARFTLAIDAGGRVTGCSVTKSTGFAPLDGATCELVTRRARFDAARDSSGKPVAGSYTGTITWKIP